MTGANWTSFAPERGARWVVAHRGASSGHCESSPEAFEAAIGLGVDAIETDVRRTADGVFICHHDETLERTAGIDRAVHSLTYAELQQLAPVLPLTEALERLRGRCNVLLDLKLAGTDDIEALATLLDAHRVDDAIAIGVRSLATQAVLRRLNPNLVQLGLLESPDEAGPFVAAGGRWVRLWEHEASPGRIAAVHAHGVPVLVMVGSRGTRFPVGEIDAAGVAALYRAGADGIMLNEPRLALAFAG